MDSSELSVPKGVDQIADGVVQMAISLPVSQDSSTRSYVLEFPGYKNSTNLNARML